MALGCFDLVGARWVAGPLLVLACLPGLGCSLILGFPEPAEEGSEACNDGLDNDDDRLVDGADPGCIGFTPEASPQACVDGEDNDGDGWVDRESPACWSWSEVQVERCSSTVALPFTSGGNPRYHERLIGELNQVDSLGGRNVGMPYLRGPSRIRTQETLGAVEGTRVNYWNWVDGDGPDDEPANVFFLYSANDLDFYGQPRPNAPAVITSVTPNPAEGVVDVEVTTPTESLRDRYDPSIENGFVALESLFEANRFLFRMRRTGENEGTRVVGYLPIPRSWAPDEPLVVVWEATRAGGLAVVWLRRSSYSPCGEVSPVLQDARTELPLAAIGTSRFQSDSPGPSCLLTLREPRDAAATDRQITAYAGPHLEGPFEEPQPIFRVSNRGEHAAALLPGGRDGGGPLLAFVLGEPGTRRDSGEAQRDASAPAVSMLEGREDCGGWRFLRETHLDLEPVLGDIARVSGGSLPRLRRSAFGIRRRPGDGEIEVLFVAEQDREGQVLTVPWAIQGTVPDLDERPWTLEEVSFARLDGVGPGPSSAWYRAQSIGRHWVLSFMDTSQEDPGVSLLVENDGRWPNQRLRLLGPSGKRGTFDDVTVGDALIVMDPDRRRNDRWSGTLLYAGGTGDQDCRGCRHLGTARVDIAARD
jgi:hypothetical protein